MRNQKGCACGHTMTIILGVIFIILPILTWLELFEELMMPLWLGIVLIILGILGLISGFVSMGKGKMKQPPTPQEPAAPSAPSENA